ncbi:nuclear transport factor 2 family protein [Streptomyces iconiensis]|uniref:Nuclear transport factor 2 family protein n=1 Tax=Streptomyces iconiensis TaxID=1384038 RepID=A0ABT6ZZ63_9ACTN|nr:nuclear transport factor 2 family protein [Streptomyces iconiensis]MDJ1134340.1 nuclear transport factor 2 family protein [Streptomyces iconiensis]
MERDLGENAIQCLRRLEAYDFDGMRAMFTRAATVWHNDGKGEQTIDEKVGQLKPLAGAFDALRFEVTRQFRKGNEVLQQQVLHLTRADRSRSEVHATVYFRFEGGLIDRMEECVCSVPAGGRPA